YLGASPPLFDGAPGCGARGSMLAGRRGIRSEAVFPCRPGVYTRPAPPVGFRGGGPSEGGPPMRRRTPGRPVALAAALLALVAAGCAMAPPVRPTSIASGAVGGIYQPIAEAIAKIARETPGLNLPLTVESTGASVANIQLLGDRKIQLGLV